ncbi:MAG: hypothetical protein PHP01_07375 [Phycisphaerae bacterium]|nr:hypothetical protein [Phycisphaerae bacterium]
MRFLFFVLSVFLPSLIDAESSSLENVPFSQCGINCVYLCLKYHHIDEKLENIYAQIKPDAENNVSLKQLADFARKKRLYIHPVVRPAFKDVEKFLTKNNSIILQYAVDLPDKTKFRHIITLVKPDQKILLLNYPMQAQELEKEKLTAHVEDSEGMLVLYPQPITSFVEFFTGRSLKSLSFYSICAGFVFVGIPVITAFKKRQAKKHENYICCRIIIVAIGSSGGTIFVM